jgi:hypothetical protein
MTPHIVPGSATVWDSARRTIHYLDAAHSLSPLCLSLLRREEITENWLEIDRGHGLQQLILDPSNFVATVVKNNMEDKKVELVATYIEEVMTAIL